MTFIQKRDRQWQVFFDHEDGAPIKDEDRASNEGQVSWPSFMVIANFMDILKKVFIETNPELFEQYDPTDPDCIDPIEVFTQNMLVLCHEVDRQGDAQDGWLRIEFYPFNSITLKSWMDDVANGDKDSLPDRNDAIAAAMDELWSRLSSVDDDDLFVFTRPEQESGFGITGYAANFVRLLSNYLDEFDDDISQPDTLRLTAPENIVLDGPPMAGEGDSHVMALEKFRMTAAITARQGQEIMQQGQFVNDDGVQETQALFRLPMRPYGSMCEVHIAMTTSHRANLTHDLETIAALFRNYDYYGQRSLPISARPRGRSLSMH